MLGYSLKPEHFTQGVAYSLLPVGYVSSANFEVEVKEHQQQEEQANSLSTAKRARSKLLGYVLQYKPMPAGAFFEARLGKHLDTMLEALLELRRRGSM